MQIELEKGTIRNVQRLRILFKETGDLVAFDLLYHWLLQSRATQYPELALKVEQELRSNLDTMKQVYKLTKDHRLGWWIYSAELSKKGENQPHFANANRS